MKLQLFNSLSKITCVVASISPMRRDPSAEVCKAGEPKALVSEPKEYCGNMHPERRGPTLIRCQATRLSGDLQVLASFLRLLWGRGYPFFSQAKKIRFPLFLPTYSTSYLQTATTSFPHGVLLAASLPSL